MDPSVCTYQKTNHLGTGLLHQESFQCQAAEQGNRRQGSNLSGQWWEEALCMAKCDWLRVGLFHFMSRLQLSVAPFISDHLPRAPRAALLVLLTEELLFQDREKVIDWTRGSLLCRLRGGVLWV